MNQIRYLEIIGLLRDQLNRLRTLDRLMSDLVIVEYIIREKKGDKVYELLVKGDYESIIDICHAISETKRNIKRDKLLRLARLHNIRYYGKMTKSDLMNALTAKGVKL